MARPGFAKTRRSGRATEVQGCSSQMHWSNPTMQIYGPYRFNAAQGAQAAGRLPQARPSDASQPKAATSPVDQLDLSPAARAASLGGPAATGGSQATSVGGDMRLDKIASIRRQIADGSYDTPEKLDRALDRFLDDFA